MTDALRQQIDFLPDRPGVYRFFNAENTIIYVGKAKSLKKRVSSYFLNKSGLDRKTQRLVSQIEMLEFTIVDTEFDALLLENNLIKQHLPKYNVLLKDGKTYPYIVITNEEYPRIFPTRQKKNGDGMYYGPYPSGKTMNALLELIKALYTVRTCSLPLTEANIAVHKWKVCLEYHIGNCKGPCENHQNKEDYRREIEEARDIIKGKLTTAKQYFKDQMQNHAANYAFEKAQRTKDRLALLENYKSKSIIVNGLVADVDVFSISTSETAGYINYTQVLFGCITNTYNLEIKKKLDESEEELLQLAILNIREMFGSKAKEIVTNVSITTPTPDASTMVPKMGDKRTLLELSLRNVMYFRRDLTVKAAEEKTDTSTDRILKKLQYDLRLTMPPAHIECFDNSNIQGTNPVAGMVCFKNGKPSKKDYRTFLIKTVVGPDDFASMKEVLTRRYKRVLDENEPLPDLIIVDGGKGQLSSAVEALKEVGIYGKVAIIGIAKRLEEIYYPEDPLPLYIEKKSESMRLIQKIRDEVHRFAITFHRLRRSKKALQHDLENLEGFGPVTITKILKEFKAISRITPENTEQLMQLIGEKRTNTLLAFLAENRERSAITPVA